MRQSCCLLCVALAGLALPATRAEQGPGSLKDGKLAQRLEILELQGGFAGFTGTYYAIEPDGSWSTGAVAPPRAEKGEPRAKGKLTPEQLAQLAKDLARYQIATLPSHGEPVVNPKVIRIHFGNRLAELQPGRGKGNPEQDRAIRARYEGIVQTVRALCKDAKRE
jgi:hypothetical protein